jgi:hypothetical protein
MDDVWLDLLLDMKNTVACEKDDYRMVLTNTGAGTRDEFIGFESTTTSNGYAVTLHPDDTVTIHVPIDVRNDELISELNRNIYRIFRISWIIRKTVDWTITILRINQ